jgi:osmotically-inducible protein OsmY
MTRSLFRIAPFALAVAVTVPALSGCVGMVIGAGAEAGVAGSQERGFSGSLDDAKIRTDINAAWLNKSGEMYRKVDLNIYEGRVMLTGYVPNATERDDAVRLTWQVSGVKEVINEIQVDPNGLGFSDQSHDLWIQQKLQSQLLFDKEVKNINYYIDVVDSVIYILGVAQNQAEMDRVLAHASDISGVKRVVNHVILINDPRRVSGGPATPVPVG